MEKGTIRSYDKGSGVGMIGRGSESDIQFFADRILGRDRTSIMMGDSVWFEVESFNSKHVAINIRKCI